MESWFFFRLAHWATKPRNRSIKIEHSKRGKQYKKLNVSATRLANYIEQLTITGNAFISYARTEVKAKARYLAGM